MRFTRLLVAVTIAAVGTLMATPATASAAPCGLSVKIGGGGPVPRYYYGTIRNCHRYTIKRRIDVSRGPDSQCIRIRGKSQKRVFGNLTPFASPNRLKPCR